MKKLLLWIVLLFLPFWADAAGTIALQGVVKSFSSESIEISDGSHIYSLKKSALPSVDLERAKMAKSGQQLELTVPFSAIISTKPVKN